MENSDTELHRELLKAMDDISFRMPEEIFTNQFDKRGTEGKYLLSLFEDAFKTVETFCEGMKIAAITQCGMLLRLLLEQVSIIAVTYNDAETLARYVRHFKYRLEISDMPKGKQFNAIKKEFSLGDDYKKPLAFLDYGWLGEGIMNEHNMEDALIIRAKNEDFLTWKKKYLDKLAHQSFTYANTADTETGSTLARPFMDIACKLFDKLCCFYHAYTGFTFNWDNESKFQGIFRPLYVSLKHKLSD
ncbi:MAG: hypothetical protein PUE65_03650 [Mollicutes bacterium]|nr:hypothetical protein [Mollicutes bacterium]